jgi:16S rRNA (uracil1498-N3)-methyltransferase
VSLLRFFIDEPLRGRSGNVELADEEARHAVSVMRLDVGDRLTLFDGRGFEASGTILEAVKKRAIISVDEVFERPRMPFVATTLYVALPRAGGADDLLRSAIEFGVTRIVPITTRRSVYRPERKDVGERAARMRKIALAAMKQSGRNVFPTFGDPESIENISFPKDGCGVFGSVDPSAARALLDLGGIERQWPASVAIAVGPEGGLDEIEETSLTGRGFTPVTLGPRVLRVENAVAAFLAFFSGLPAVNVRPAS